jgi:hypothetical protein
MMNEMWSLVAVMLLAGCLGGVINYFFALKNDPENSHFVRSITVGVGSSFLVPLFLNMISSNLIDSIVGTNAAPKDLSKILVFAGLCLVAAISSTAFIRTLSDRILSEAKAARKDAKQAKLVAEQAKDDVGEVQATIDPIVEKGTEPEPSLGKGATSAEVNSLSEIEKTILEAFARSKYTHRTLRGLSLDTGIEMDKIEPLLSSLASTALVGRLETKNGPRWFITQTGLNVSATG